MEKKCLVVFIAFPVVTFAAWWFFGPLGVYGGLLGYFDYFALRALSYLLYGYGNTKIWSRRRSRMR